MNEKVIEKEIEFLKQEIQEIKAINSDVRELASQVKVLATEMTYMREAQNSHEKRIKILEDKPAKKYDNYVSFIITTIISLIIGFLFASIGIKK